jgi:hypothetical protein
MGYIPETKVSFILECILNKNGIIESYNYHPVHINDDFQPMLLEGNEKDNAINKLNWLASLINTSNIDYNETYGKDLLVRKRNAKQAMKRHFIRNICKYPPAFSISVIVDYVRKFLK